MVARKFPVDINLLGNALLNATLQSLTSAPAAAVGRFYYDSTLKQIGFSDGTGWYYTNTGTGTGATDTEAVQDIVGSLIQGTSITVTYNDAANTLTLALADASVTDAKVASGAAISADKLADGTTNKILTAAERTKLAGVATGATANQTDAYLLNRANHTGTESADVLTDGTTNAAYTQAERTKLSGIAAGATAYTNAQALANALNSFAVPTAALNAGGFKITNGADPTNATDFATKQYVDAAISGLDIKTSVKVATTANITLSGTQTIDGIAVVAGDRVLVKNQTTASGNGLYVVAAGAWTRTTDADNTGNTGEVTSGLFTFVEQGTVNASTGWVLTTTGAITLGTTSLTFTQFSGAGSWTAGNGLTQTGTTMNVVGGTGITVNADNIQIDTSIVARKASGTIGDGSATAFVVTHSFNNTAVAVSVHDTSTGEEVDAYVVKAANTVTVTFNTAPTTGQYQVTVIG